MIWHFIDWVFCMSMDDISKLQDIYFDFDIDSNRSDSEFYYRYDDECERLIKYFRCEYEDLFNLLSNYKQ